MGRRLVACALAAAATITATAADLNRAELWDAYGPLAGDLIGMGYPIAGVVGALVGWGLRARLVALAGGIAGVFVPWLPNLLQPTEGEASRAILGWLLVGLVAGYYALWYGAATLALWFAAWVVATIRGTTPGEH